MAPISGLINNNTLSPRAGKQYAADMDSELFLAKLLLGFIGAAWVVFFGFILYLKLKPKYEQKWKPKLRDCKKKHEGWIMKIAGDAKEPKAPEPAHVARHSSQSPGVNRITRDLTPKYMRMSTAAIV